MKAAGAAVGVAGAAALAPVGTRAALLDALRGGGAAPFPNPAPPGARLPRLRPLPGGGIVLSWVEPADTEHRLMHAVLRGEHWDAPVQVARGPRWFVNWADFPSVVPVDAQFWVAHWLVRRSEGRTYDYDVALAVSRDSGASWSMPFAPYRDTTPAEHGFVSIFPVGRLAGVIWLDGREYAPSAEQARAQGKSGNFALRYATVSPDGAVTGDTVVDANVCTCCQTSVATTARGPMVAYRGRTPDEIRDNLTALLAAGRWQPGRPLGPDGWRIAACPVNGPAIAARGGNVAAVWFTGAGNRGRVLAALSSDAGTSFGQPVELDGQDPVGRVAVEWIDDRSAAIAWIGPPDREGGAGFNWCRLDRDGRVSAARRIATVSAERHSGFPQIVPAGRRMLSAWTDGASPAAVRTAWVDTA